MAPTPDGNDAADVVRVSARSSHRQRRRGLVNMLLAPLRPLADVLDLTAEAVAAVGTVSVTALGLALARRVEPSKPHPRPQAVPSPWER